jgi:hypothetical protein
MFIMHPRPESRTVIRLHATLYIIPERFARGGNNTARVNYLAITMFTISRLNHELARNWILL